MVPLSSEPHSALTTSCINIISVCSLFKDNPGIIAHFLFSLDRFWRMIQFIILKSSLLAGWQPRERRTMRRNDCSTGSCRELSSQGSGMAECVSPGLSSVRNSAGNTEVPAKPYKESLRSSATWDCACAALNVSLNNLALLPCAWCKLI